jgi:hypothetical protein
MLTITSTAAVAASQNAILAASGPTWAGSARAVAAGPNTFFLIYYDQYGGVWRTDAIEAAAPDASNYDSVTAERTQAALRNLPNEVLEGVTVTARSAAAAPCTRALDGVQNIPSAEGHGTTNICTAASATGAPTASNVALNVQFADKPGQTGVQYLLEINAAYQGDGAFPVSRGFLAGTTTTLVQELHTPDVNSKDTISELAECSDRGLDNGDGECECFDGFRGLACEEQEALV